MTVKKVVSLGQAAMEKLGLGLVKLPVVMKHYYLVTRAWILYTIRHDKSPKEFLAGLTSGFRPKYYYILGLDQKPSDLHVSRDSFEYIGGDYPGPIMSVNENARFVLNDKIAVYNIFSELSERFPTLYATVHDGEYNSEDGGDTQSVIQAVERYGTVAMKPIDGQQGDDFYKISKQGDTLLINGEVSSASEIEEICTQSEYSHFMLTEYITQHEYADRINPSAVNSIRLLTVFDTERGEHYVARAGHRFGTEESHPVDNFENGGVIAPIDPETGEMDALVTLDEDGNRARLDRHPDTESKVTGKTIPMWDEVTSIALKGATSYPHAKIIGWDFVVTDDGPMILEASAQPGPTIPQVERGLLKDPVVRQMIESA